MDELVDILDENGKYTGETTMKSKAHKMGLFHPTVHIWCYTKTGKILLQQREANKKTYPLKWDVSVAGHMGAGESPELSAFREVQEEIGVTINTRLLEKVEILKMERKHSETIWDREFTHVFLYLLDEEVTLKKQDSEVKALKWIPLETFESLVFSEDKGFVPNSKERYLRVLQKIKSRL